MNRIKIEIKERLFSLSLLIPVLWLIIPNTKGFLFWKITLSNESIASRQYLLEGSPFDRIILFVLLGIALTIIIKRKNALSKILKRNWIPIFFIFYMAVAIFWGDYQFIALKRWIKTFGTLVMIILISTERKPFNSGMLVLQITSYFVTISSWILVLFLPSFGKMNSLADGSFWTGITMHKNQLGLWMLIGIIASIWQFKKCSNRFDKIVSVFMFILAIGLLWGSNSRTSQLLGVLIVVLSIVFSLSQKIGKYGLPLSISFSAVFFCGTLLYLQITSQESIFDKFMTIIGKDKTLTGRSSIWEIGKEVGDKRPIIGHGYGTFWLTDDADYIRQQCNWEFYSAHNGYLDIYLECGLLGIIVLLIFLIGGGRNILYLLKTDYLKFEISIIAFIIVLLSNMSESSFGLTSHQLWFLAIFICFDFMENETIKYAPSINIL